MNIWFVSREYAGIAEAGGVKNVTCSLCEELARTDKTITCFLPLYGCTQFDAITDYKADFVLPVSIMVCGRQEQAVFNCGFTFGRKIRIIFVQHPAFLEKQAVYTYTESEQLQNPDHLHGEGHRDSKFLDTLFQKAVVAYGNLCIDIPPDIVHCQDAAASLVPVFMEIKSTSFFSGTKCIVTIHNAGPYYHHEFSSINEAAFFTGLPKKVLKKGENGKRIEPFLLAAVNSTMTTVSPEYAKELLQKDNPDTDGLSAEFSLRGIPVKGITNGIDCEQYEPADITKSLLPYAFDPPDNVLEGKYKCRAWFLEKLAAKELCVSDNAILPYLDDIKRYGYLGNDKRIYFSYHGRIVYQKGIDILAEAAEFLIEKYPQICFIVVGQGEGNLENRLERMAGQYAGNFIYYKGYNKRLSRLCTASGDFIILPSIFEPCGLEDMIAQLFGTLPVANKTGGLAKILDGKTGFLYEPDTAAMLENVLTNIIESFPGAGDYYRNMAAAAAKYIKEKYSWQAVTREKYLPLYREVLSDSFFHHS